MQNGQKEIKMLAPQIIKSEKCLRCSRPLSNPVSMYVGFGPICSEILGIPRPEYDALMKLNPDATQDLSALQQAREKLEAKNQIEGAVTLQEQEIITKLPYKCKDFDAIKAVLKSLMKNGVRWNNIEKQWHVPHHLVYQLVNRLKGFPNLAIDEELLAEAESQTPPPQNAICLSVGLVSSPIDRGIEEYKGQNIAHRSLPSPTTETKPKFVRWSHPYDSETQIPSGRARGTKPTRLENLATQMKKRLEKVDVTNATLKNGLQLFLKKENDTYKVFCARTNVLPSKVEIRVIGNSFFGKGQWEFGKAKTAPPLPTEGYVIQSKKGEA